MRQLAQPSSSSSLPSSHSSLPAMMPSPQSAARQAAPATGHTQPGSRTHLSLQPSPFLVLRSSHCSSLVSAPLPHWLVLVHLPPAMGQVWLGSTAPQLPRQPSPLLVLPSSQASLPARMLSPHWAATHAAPAAGHTLPGSTLHCPSQPSPAWLS